MTTPIYTFLEQMRIKRCIARKKDLVTRLGISSSYLQQIERGEKPMSSQVRLNVIAKLYLDDAEVVWLDNAISRTPIVKTMISITNATPLQIREIKFMIEAKLNQGKIIEGEPHGCDD